MALGTRVFNQDTQRFIFCNVPQSCIYSSIYTIDSNYTIYVYYVYHLYYLYYLCYLYYLYYLYLYLILYLPVSHI